MRIIKIQVILLILSIIICINCITLDVPQKINVYYDSWVPRLITACCQPINGITLGHNIFIWRDRWTADMSFTLEHELVHIKQIEKYSVLGFYTFYLLESVRYGYLNNPFELEAMREAINIDTTEFTYTIFE